MGLPDSSSPFGVAMIDARWLPATIATALLLAAGLRGAEPVPDPQAMTRRVDQLLNRQMEEAGIAPGDLCTDAEFLRRAALDLTGRIPRVSETRAFLADSREDRRQRLIDDLLTRPSHATHLAVTWRKFLLPDSADVTRFGGAQAFEFWLRQQFAENVRYDQLTRDILLAQGAVNQGPTLFYASLENKPESLAATTSRAFLGVQIDCAQCHDHPQDKWTQEDFWSYAAFFAQVQSQTQPGTLRVVDADAGEVMHPTSGQAIKPRYLGGPKAIPQPGQTRRQLLAGWLTSTDNRYFAQAAVNRLWAQLFGRGLVEPVDDLGEHNPPSHPELMQELVDYFIATDYDVRNLLRVLANTEAYQRTSRIRDGETPAPPELFARMPLKTLSAEQLYDSLLVATGRREEPPRQMNDPSPLFNQEEMAFLDKFRAPTASVTEYHGGIPQALTLMNGALVGSGTSLEQSSLLRSLEAPFFTDEQRVETLFLAVLSRPPHADERRKFLSYLESRLTAAERKRALSDILWALLNTGEFALNH